MIKYLVPLTLLYTLEGLSFGLVMVSIPKHLDDLKLSYFPQAFTYVVLVPFLFRFLVVPFLDCLSVSKFGRRRSQLIFFLTILGCLLYLMPLDELDSTDLLFKMLYIMILISLIDSIVGAWIVESIEVDDRGYGAMAQYFGIIVGAFVGSFGFATFNSLAFCNTYIYAVPQEVPMITLTSALRDLGLASLGLAVMVVVMVREGNTQNQNILEVYRSMLHFKGNQNLTLMMLFLSVFRIALLPIDLAHHYLLATSFQAGQIQFMQIVAFPFACVLPFYISQLVQHERLEIRYILILQVYKIFTSVALVAMIYFLEIGFNLPYRNLILNCCLVAGWLFNLITITLAYSFVYKITKSCASATYVCLLSTCIIFQFILSTALENYMTHFYTLWLCGIGLYFLFLKYMGSQLLALQIDQLESAEFSLEIDIKQERLIATELTTLQ